MKVLKIIASLLISIFILIIIGYYAYQNRVLKNLQAQKTEVANSWNSFNLSLKNRDSILNSIPQNSPDSLKYFIEKSAVERTKSENTVDLEFYEYKINSLIQQDFPSQKTILEIQNSLNESISEYNSLAKSFNFYLYSFPNFFFARRNYSAINMFAIEYGKTNPDPIHKSKELPEWAKGVDTN